MSVSLVVHLATPFAPFALFAKKDSFKVKDIDNIFDKRTMGKVITRRSNDAMHLWGGGMDKVSNVCLIKFLEEGREIEH